MITFALPDGTLDKLVSLSETGDSTGMQGLSIIEEQDKIKGIVSDFMDISSYHYGNLFSHVDPFTMHADISDKKRTILLMPIQAAPDQHFVVFDQTVEQLEPVSWIWNIFDNLSEQELADRYYLSALKSRPCEYKNTRGLTNQPCSEDLFEYLPYSREFYYGMSGRAWPYTPGQALLFPANHIHATGKMSAPKVGCTVQFNLDYPEVLAGLCSTIKHSQF